ncbi:helix-turn-helix domain-containing protein [Streptomyces lancefieldiae]|uniref:DUF2690 domain-containing protein n=1 Tax=Streptomyces lancefieldiae TaxID=3075520 RepID=A0ABU3AJV9_9ACTN|nr:DUF2690 domain-containing protein [Streptomyces sp. DSM 40712]MDT0610274.1 DUF2690 domain-containing protein [Streptomyces sp. DSM 40712]
MPRWKALPDELDPQIREFTSQLRRLVDRGELSIASVADATGYSKTSWERYLNGRLLAPKGAVVALAEVTGTNPVHLTTMWELAERAWSRSEMRHDMTMEAIRISQARAALGELGTPAAKSDSGGRSGRGSRAGRHSAGATPGIAGPAGVSPTLPPPTVPAQPTATDSPDSAMGAVRGGGTSGAPSGTSSGAPSGTSPGTPYGTSSGGPSDGNSWGLAGYRGPAPTGGRAARPATGTGGAAGTAPMPAVALGGPEPSDTYGEPPRGGSSGRRRSSGGGSKRMTTFVAGVVGVLVVVAGAFFLLDDGGGEKNEGTKPSPSPTVSSNPELPPGVKCGGDLCTGKDPEVMGCGGDLVTTAATATVGTAAVEVRYSKTCGAAWARVTQAAQGDEVRVSADGRNEQTGAITAAGDTVAYTPMVAVKSGAEAKACVTLSSGRKGCTE